MMTSRWIKYFFKMAKLVASQSKDPSTKVGCVVTDSLNRVLATGYNGFPRGVQDTEDRYNDRSVKYKLVVHAEANAVCMAASSGVNLTGATIYITSMPCPECAKLIVQSGIRTVYYIRPSDEERKRRREKKDGAVDWLHDASVNSLLMFEEACVAYYEMTEEVYDE